MSGLIALIAASMTQEVGMRYSERFVGLRAFSSTRDSGRDILP